MCFSQVIDRILYKLDDLVRPYVHKILVVIEPLLIDEDYYARVEGREIISNLAKVGTNLNKRIVVNNYLLWFFLKKNKHAFCQVMAFAHFVYFSFMQFMHKW